MLGSFDFSELQRAFAIFMFKRDFNARARLWRKLSKLLSDGIPILAALDAVVQLRAKDDPHYIAASEWRNGLKRGRRFSEVCRPWLSSHEALILVAGDESGRLSESLEQMIFISKSLKKIRTSVYDGLAYPIFLVVLSFGVMFLFGTKIIPAFTSAASGGAQWTGMAGLMIAVAEFVRSYIFLVAAGVMGLAGLVVFSLPRWNGRLRVFLDRFAPYSIYRTIEGASWIISLASLVHSGLRIERSIEQLMSNSSPWSRLRMAAILQGLKTGQNIGQSMASTGYDFPDREIIADINVYSARSGFDEALRIIGEDWVSESEERVGALMKKVFGVTLLLAGGVIVFMVSGLFAMQLQLGQLIQRQLVM